MGAYLCREVCGSGLLHQPHHAHCIGFGVLLMAPSGGRTVRVILLASVSAAMR